MVLGAKRATTQLLLTYVKTMHIWLPWTEDTKGRVSSTLQRIIDILYLKVVLLYISYSTATAIFMVSCSWGLELQLPLTALNIQGVRCKLLNVMSMLLQQSVRGVVT